MRTTLEIDDEVLLAIKDIARRSGDTAGRVLSNLARQALTQTTAARGVKEPEAFYGFKPLPAGERVVTNELVDRLRDEEGI